MRTLIEINREDDTWYRYTVDMAVGSYGAYEQVAKGRATSMASAEQRAIEDAKSYLREKWADDLEHKTIRMDISLEDVQ